MYRCFWIYLLCLATLSFSACGNSPQQTLEGPSQPPSQEPSQSPPHYYSRDYLENYPLKPEFEICSQWHPGMTWDEFQQIRTELQRPELIPYVNKIEANQMFEKQGFPVVPILYSSTQKEDFLDVLRALDVYVAKPCHNSQSNGLIIVENGYDIHTNTPITVEEVQERMFKAIDTPSNSNEWILQNIKRGFVIQEFIKGRQEFKFQTIWGKAVFGSLREGKTLQYHFYDLDGNVTRAPSDPLPDPYKPLYKEALALAEKVAAGTDALRVDILVKDPDGPHPTLMLNEVELRSQLRFRPPELAERLNEGYAIYCGGRAKGGQRE